LDHAVISREGIDRIRQTYKSKPYNVTIELVFSDSEADFASSRYGLTLSGKQGEYRVESETANYVATRYSWDPEKDAPDNVSNPQRFERTRDGQLLIDNQPFERRIRPDMVALGQSIDLDELGGSIANFARGWHFCSLYPNTLRRLSPPTKEDRLAEDGSNWASVVRAMKRTKAGRQSLERIAEVMRIAVDGYVDINVETAGSYLVPRITLSGHRGGAEKQQRFDPIQLSDGTLRVFGILLALYQTPAPELLIIEEPEQTIPPGVLPALAEACKEAAQRTQIVITTHSPHLVDQFAPEDIRIAWLKDGLTHVSQIKSTQLESVKRRLMSLQEYMLAEGLQPEVTNP
jgi:predicted ATPase